MVKTKLTKKEIEEHLGNYDVGRLNDFSYFERGVEHTNILLDTSSGKWVLRVYERGRTGEFVNFELKLLQRLAKYDYPTPAPVRTTQSQSMVLFKGKPVVLFNYVKGIHLKNPNKHHIGQVGKVLAELHVATAGFKPEGHNFRWDATTSRIKNLADKMIKKGMQENIRNIEFVGNTIKQEFRSFSFPKTLPKGTIHADLFKDNIKFYQGKISGILDFDDSFYGCLIDDLTTAILGWCFLQNKLNLSLAKRMVAAYQKVKELNMLEKKHLYWSLRFMAVKFSVYLLNRMEREKNAGSFMVERLLSLQEISPEHFEMAVLR